MNTKEYRELKGLIEQLAEFVAEQFHRIEGTKADKADVQRIVDEANEKQTDKILSVMDKYAKEFHDQKQEHRMLKGQVNRHDRWINKIALKTDVKLDY